jgi:predicted nuclease of predicted toxin-antitoxin system
MRFLVDENLPAELADILNKMNHDAIAVVGSVLEGSEDEELWRIAHNEDRILISQDLDFPLNLSPTPPGLVLIRIPSRFDVDTMLTLVTDFFAGQTEESLLGKITVHAPGHTRNRDL